MEYSDNSNIFLIKNATEFSENTRTNKHAIEQKKDKQSSFKSIYSLGLIKLETLKIYIKINLDNGFVWLFKSFVEASILFDKKLDRSFHFCVDYKGLNNLIIKNRYPLSLINESLDQLSRAKQFI